MKLYDVIRKDSSEERTEQSLEEIFNDELAVPIEHPKKKRKRVIFIAIILTGLAALYIFSFYFVKAKVYIEQRAIPFNLDKVSIDLPHETKSDTERLSFQTMTVTAELTRDIFGSEIKNVTGKATGSVVLFNEYSTSSITLKSGTKLVATNGKQYVTGQNVAIPGYKIVNQKKTPGTSTSISITAVDVGAASNSDGTSLSISGYSGIKKTQVYARSIGGFSGGESGIFHTVSDVDKPQIITSLEAQLNEKLKRETRAQIPDQLITYPDLQFISIDTKSIKLEGEGIKFPAYIKGTMVSYLIPRNLFESAIAKESLSDHSYTTVSIPELANLSVTPSSGIPADTQVTPDSITINVSGQGTIITEVSPERIKESLIGMKRSLFNNVLSQIPEVSSAHYSLLPFWAPLFPKQQSDISVILK